VNGQYRSLGCRKLIRLDQKECWKPDLESAASTASAVYLQTVVESRSLRRSDETWRYLFSITFSTLALFKAKEGRHPSAISFSGPSTFCGRFETFVGIGLRVLDIRSHRCSVVVI
jgi:hypothetical protein